MAETMAGFRGARTGAGAAVHSRPRLAASLVLGCYLAAALVLAWRLWAGPASRAQVIAANSVSDDMEPAWPRSSATTRPRSPTVISRRWSRPRSTRRAGSLLSGTPAAAAPGCCWPQ